MFRHDYEHYLHSTARLQVKSKRLITQYAGEDIVSRRFHCELIHARLVLYKYVEVGFILLERHYSLIPDFKKSWRDFTSFSDPKLALKCYRYLKYIHLSQLKLKL